MTAQSVAPPRTTFCPATRRKYVLAAAILASALGFIDGSILAIAIPAIRTDLGASFVEAQWISNAYALTLSALILIGGAAGDRFGLRLTFIAGIALFILASLACALAASPVALIGFRAVQGIGAAIMVPCSLAIIAKAYPKAERGRAIGIWAAASALTTALGPLLGGFVLAAFDTWIWRVIFAINLPLGAIAIILLVVRVPLDRPAQRRALDLVGATLATLGFGGLAWGLTEMSVERAGRPTALAPAAMLIGVLVVVLFAWWEWRRRDPMVDLALFRIRQFSGANIATFFLYFSLSAILFYLPMLLIAGWGRSSGDAGFIFLPLSAAIALLSGPVGHWADRAGPRLPIAVGNLIVGLSFAGLAVMMTAGIHAFWTGVFPLMVLLGLGMALVVSPLSAAIMTSVQDSDTGAASGINNAVSRIAGLVAVAAMGALAAFTYAQASGGADIPGFGESPTATLDAAADSLRLAASDQAFAAVSAFSAALCLLAALVTWLMVDDQAKESEKRA